MAGLPGGLRRCGTTPRVLSPASAVAVSRRGILISLAAALLLGLSGSCSSGGANSPTVGGDIVELDRMVSQRLDQAVSRGTASPADKQQFLGNLGAGDSGAIV